MVLINWLFQPNMTGTRHIFWSFYKNNYEIKLINRNLYASAELLSDLKIRIIHVTFKTLSVLFPRNTTENPFCPKATTDMSIQSCTQQVVGWHSTRRPSGKLNTGFRSCRPRARLGVLFAEENPVNPSIAQRPMIYYAESEICELFRSGSGFCSDAVSRSLATWKMARRRSDSPKRGFSRNRSPQQCCSWKGISCTQKSTENSRVRRSGKIPARGSKCKQTFATFPEFAFGGCTEIDWLAWLHFCGCGLCRMDTRLVWCKLNSGNQRYKAANWFWDAGLRRLHRRNLLWLTWFRIQCVNENLHCERFSQFFNILKRIY